MEKMEKNEKVSQAKYYSDLFTLLKGDNKLSFMFDTKSFYKEAKSLDKRYGINYTNKNAYAARLWNTLRTFKKIFSNCIEEVEDDTYKGNGSRMIYSITIKPEDVVGLELKILKKFPMTKRTLVYKKVEEKKVEEKKVEEIISSPSLKPKKFFGKKLKIDFAEKFLKLLKLANGNDGKVSTSNIKTIMEYSKIPSLPRLVSEWRTSLNRVLIISMSVSVHRDKKEGFLKFENLNSLILDLKEHYIEWYGSDLGATDALKITPAAVKKEREIKSPHSVGTKIPYNIAHAVYILGGLCKLEGGLVSFDSIYRTMRDKFSIDCPKQETIRLVKDYGFEWLELNTTTNPGVIAKRDADWDKFSIEFGPKNYSRAVISRLGMTEIEIDRFNFKYIKIELVSKITESDAIYKIVFDRSEHSMRDLCRLARSFRGVDQIFDDELVEKINDLNNLIDSRSFSGNPTYEIESNLN